MNQSQLAAKVGISRASISDWMTGKTKAIEGANLSQAADALNVDPRWLATGNGPRERNRMSELSRARDAAVLFAINRSTVPQWKVRDLMAEAQRDHLDLDELEKRHGAEFPPAALLDGFVMIPRYDLSASAGHGALVPGEQIADYLAFKAEWVRNTLGIAQKDLALIGVKGDSMQPTLTDGDLVLIDTSRTIVEDSGIYAINLAEALMVKRVQRHLNGSLTVSSDNAKYAPERVQAKDGKLFRVVGRVVWTGRRL